MMELEKKWIFRLPSLRLSIPIDPSICCCCSVVLSVVRFHLTCICFLICTFRFGDEVCNEFVKLIVTDFAVKIAESTVFNDWVRSGSIASDDFRSQIGSLLFESAHPSDCRSIRPILWKGSTSACLFVGCDFFFSLSFSFLFFCLISDSFASATSLVLDSNFSFCSALSKCSRRKYRSPIEDGRLEW